MAEKSDTLKQNTESQPVTNQGAHRDEILKALRRLREIGEKLPVIDAVAIVREGRDLAEQGSR